jgi:hypothetical protein
VPRYTLLPGKKHYYHDGTQRRLLEAGETIELSEKAYAAVHDKFVPEGSHVKDSDVAALRKRLAEAEAELKKRDNEAAAKERGAAGQAPTAPKPVAPAPAVQVTETVKA